ncbi:MAG: endonuclease III [Desulfarculales bacterium]|nr:endonuclease III [Desulfarculales bacterium]
MPNKIGAILRGLKNMYPQAGCGLDFAGPWQLLAATILSAQCTDQRVNRITPVLFARYPDPPAAARADREEMMEIIKSAGFFQNKARAIIGAARMIERDYDGQVPNQLEELIKLPGVGRKTANVVLGNAFAIPGITVDTHVGRVSRRLGLSAWSDPEKVERDLMALVPEKDWTEFSHQMICHGREICKARQPECPRCGLNDCCQQGEAGGEMGNAPWKK